MHFVLYGLHADTPEYAGGLYPLGRPALAVSCLESVAQDLVEWVLYACQRLGRVVVLVVNVQVVALHGLLCLLGQQVVVDEGLGGLAAELHHHAGRRVGVHVGVLACNVVVLDVDYFEEYVPCLSLSCHAPCVAVLDVGLCHVLARTLHQFVLHHVLYLFHGHLAASPHRDAVGNLFYQSLVVAFVGGKHCLADGGRNLLLVESHYSSISFYYGLYHIAFLIIYIMYSLVCFLWGVVPDWAQSPSLHGKVT